MPGWWFTIESATTRHFIQQLKMAIEDALRARNAMRAIMRARATKQRFPVSVWVEDLEKLQSSAIEISHKQASREKRPTLVSPSTPAILETPGMLSVLQSRFTKPSLHPRPAVAQASSQIGGLSSIAEGRLLVGLSPGLGSKLGPSSRRKPPPPPLIRNTTGMNARIDLAAGSKQSIGESSNDIRRPSIVRAPSTPNLRPRDTRNERQTATTVARKTMKRSPSMPQMRQNDQKVVRLLGVHLPANHPNLKTTFKQVASSSDGSTPPSSTISTPITPVSANTSYYTPESTPSTLKQSFSVPSNTFSSTTVNANTNSTIIHTPHAVDMFPSKGPHYFPHGSVAVLSTSEVKEEKPDNVLQNVTPFFSDPQKEYEAIFKQKLEKLNGKNSESLLCIEEYLLKSEKSWFGKLRAAELGKYAEGDSIQQSNTAMVQEVRKKAKDDGFGLGANYKPPSGLKRIMRLKFGDWPIYSFFLAFVSKTCPNNVECPTYMMDLQGQIIAANSYQITLLSGTIGESANKLYVIASVYLATSFGWWLLYRKLQTVYVVSFPFFFYGLSFFLIGVSPLQRNPDTGNWLRNVATGLYSVASSSGALFFAVNFADEGTKYSLNVVSHPMLMATI